MATKKIDDNINTIDSVFKDSNKTDAELFANQMKEDAKINKCKRVKFKCDIAYAALYPNGFESTCQGRHVRIIFDGRVLELPDFIADFVKAKIEKKALSLVDKKTRNASKQQEYLGMEYVG